MERFLTRSSLEELGGYVYMFVYIKLPINPLKAAISMLGKDGPWVPTANPPSSSKLERVRVHSNLLPYHHSPTSSPPEASRLDASNLLIYLFIGGGISMPQAATGCHRAPQVATGCQTL